MGLDSCSEEMECPAAKPSETPSNIPDLVSKFAKVCKLRSIGVFTSENHCDDGGQGAPVFLDENKKGLTKEKFDSGKLCPRYGEEGSIKGCGCCLMDISELFDSVSAVKVAYVKFQEAHIPYDHEKIVAADKHMVDQLGQLCKIKQSFKEKKKKEENSVAACSALVKKEIQVQESLLEQLKSTVKMKESAVVKLQRELQDLELKNKSLAEEFKQQEKVRVNVLHTHSFEVIVKAVRMAIHDFAKPLISLMKVSGWDLDQAANAIEAKVVYAKRSHKKYAFEAYIARRMLNGFSCQQPCDTQRILKFNDPINALIEDPHSDFAKFCRKKYLVLVHPWMETSFFGNLDHRTFVANGLHPYTPFYRAFVKMAKWVWCLQGSIASSTTPKIETFTVTRGAEFSDVYMESIEELKENALMSGQEGARYKVEFMILPGFKVGKSVIRSQVYLSKVNSEGSKF
ncbi:OLC1v1006422C1 [Oldenlandia corymbosa var. corymbosa]|uniref:OLC1v1006422C1 n=1 Tax=Oldenlandia corymbosa var. corymbosa TaxID=529605 RepID=A0AAV1DIE0_OLDCO|nr:OLC1v1006422C1 [Oldenlandia corymbosa var. corymbosa]